MSEAPHRLCAHLSSLPGLGVPPALSEIIRRRELQLVEGDIQTLDPTRPRAFALIWVDDRWPEGLERIAGVEALERRARCVLIGREPPADVGPKLRALGALTYLREDFPAWLVQPIQSALDRLATQPSSPSYALLHALRGPKLEHETAVLDALLRLSVDLFQADVVRLLVRSGDDSALSVLQARGRSVQLVPWAKVDLFDPTPLFDAVDAFGGQIALPSLEHARAVDGLAPIARTYRAAAATSCQVGAGLRAAIVLFWHERFLLNPIEVVTLDALAQLAGAAWSQLTVSLAARGAESSSPAAAPASAAVRGVEPKRQMLRTVAEMAGAHGALLLLCDTEEAPARLHFAGEWLRLGYAAGEQRHRSLHCALPGSDKAAVWRQHVAGELQALGCKLRVLELMLLPPAERAAHRPAGAVVLVGESLDSGRFSSLGFMLRLSAARERLRLDWLLLEPQVREVADAAFERFHALSVESPPCDMQAMLQQGAELVAEVVPADQVLIQYGRAVASFPELSTASELCSNETSLTRYAKRARKTVRLLNVEDGERPLHHRLDHAALASLSDTLGRGHVRSLIVCPIGDDAGILKVLTFDRGAYLTAADAKLVTSLASKLGQLAAQTQRGEVLGALSKLASNVAGLAGQQLAASLVSELEQWSARFVRPNCQVFLQAQDAHGSTVLSGASSSLPEALRRQLEVAPLPAKLDHGQFAHVPLSLAHAGMSGSLFLYHRQHLPGDAADHLRDAAREVSLLLNAEYVRHELRKQVGMFRHELMGPIQGLASNASLLLRELKEAGPLAPNLERCVRAILDEARLVGQWRERHRLFASFQEHGRLDVRRFCGELRPLVVKCVERFESAIAERNLSLRCELPRGGVQALFDAYALDIALSNLLDNAVKYAFYNREIVVGMQMHRGSIDIFIEDVGHGIPVDRAEQIYVSGGRARQPDPLRVIHGEGLGLYIAREIARAHDGDLTHWVRPEGREGSDKTPYRVRFTLTLQGG